MKVYIFVLFLLFSLPFSWVTGQLSPGKLASVHTHLEGLSNCTRCHSLGNKVTNEKCLECHKELNARIMLQRGFHVSAGVKGKPCTSCHSDHHGLNFQIIRFDPEKFDHHLTGYPLTGAHGLKKCRDCHQPAFIADRQIRAKKFTYLGLNTACLSCHDDYHQKTLTEKCSDCHSDEHFKPAAKFDHNKTAYKLTGRHTNVPCQSCHPVTLRNNKKFQVFTGLNYSQCTGCHTDAHNNRFGQQCNDCHSTSSFRDIKNKGSFDHSKTAFPLEGRHQGVSCASCHKNGVSVPLNHSSCTDCHNDYHNGQFARDGVLSNCSECHSTSGFTSSTFTIERHNAESVFLLKGAHLATPCFACHKKTEKWNFRGIGLSCDECHTNVHDGFMTPDHYSAPGCTNCHNEAKWNTIVFDHKVTRFPLEGAHNGPACRTCHYPKNNAGAVVQLFKGLSSACVSCHSDNHERQFDENGFSECARCHSKETWRIEKFNHDRTAFKLDGRHRELACQVCHTSLEKAGKKYVLYKLNKSKCEDCH